MIPQVSIVIPVYNAGRYISQCLQSITSQSVRDIEIILVDDGSTDNSKAVIAEFLRKDSRINYFPKENGGAASARNFGILKATGKYITFIDADDHFADEKVIERMLEAFDHFFGDNNSSFLMLNIKHFYEGRNTFGNADAYPENINQGFSKKEMLQKITENGQLLASPCFRLIPRQWLISEGIFFPEGNIGEDVEWNFKLLEKCERFALLNDYSYIYRKGNDSSVTGTFTADIVIRLLRSYSEMSESYKNSSAISDYVMNGLAYQYAILLGNAARFSLYKNKEVRNWFREMKWLLNYTANPKVKKVALLVKLVGLKWTSWFLNYYIKNHSHASDNNRNG